MTVTCHCGRPLPATRLPWYADDHDGADLIGECGVCKRLTVEVE